MSREIKFRAFNKNNGTMLYDKSGAIHNLGFWQEVIKSGFYELQQYTGLKDKNGKEIYEGDILAHLNTSVYQYLERENNEPREGIWIDKTEGVNITRSFSEKVIYGIECKAVRWQDDLTGFYPFADSPDNCGHCGGGYSPSSFEIVGNIYENPNLLTPTKEGEEEKK